MSRWRMVRLGDVCDFLGGGTPSKKNPNFYSGAIPWATVKDFKNNVIDDTEDHITEEAVNSSATRVVPAETVLLVTRVGVGKVAITGRPMAINQDIKAVVPKSDEYFDKQFLAWSLIQRAHHLERVATGATVKGITLDQVRSHLIQMPPLPEQRRIVDILNHANSIRRLRREALEKARAMIPALFVEMFGDPATNPRGWEVVKLATLITDGPQNGLYKHASAYGEGTPILRIDAFYNGVMTGISSLRRVRLSAEEIEHYRLNKNDIIINRVNSPEYLGKSAITPSLVEPTVFESNMMRFAIDLRVIHPIWFINYLQTSFIKQQILSKAKHAINQSSINQQDVKSLTVPLPPHELQSAFAERVADIHALIDQQERQLAKADELMNALMAKFFGNGTGLEAAA